jgi:hypothetical protein
MLPEFTGVRVYLGCQWHDPCEPTSKKQKFMYEKTRKFKMKTDVRDGRINKQEDHSFTKSTT